MDAQLLAAVRAGDTSSLDRLLRTASADALAGDEGSGLLRAAVFGGNADVVASLLQAGADPTRPWDDGVDPVSWAADFGAYEVLWEMVHHVPWWRKQVPQHLKRGALDIARLWLGLDPEVELRRRLGAHPDEPAAVERIRILTREQEPEHATRIRLTLADGRQAETQLDHRAIVTYLEHQFDIPVTPDELLARALFHADPQSWDWAQAQAGMADHLSAEDRFRWAANLVAHPSVDTRRFATQLLHYLGCDEQPLKAQASEVLRPRLRAEDDPIALGNVIGAFAEYTGRGDVTDVLHQAGHPDPGIRADVAGVLSNAIGEHPRLGIYMNLPPHPFDTPPGVVAALIHFAADRDGHVRATALLSLAESGLDTPAVLALLTAHLTDDYLYARLNAAIGLAIREDQHGLEVLRETGSEMSPTDGRRWRVDEVEKILEHRAAADG
ncbi:HEAT repeat domain-containing protein [Micromonospora sp. NPDC049175]|uniref:HEAT repeat domain-containing protein n=1 Tax=Micromonospora sp. NPDC049175 TaxID=3364266 RepID=UPI00372266BD